MLFIYLSNFYNLIMLIYFIQFNGVLDLLDDKVRVKYLSCR